MTADIQYDTLPEHMQEGARRYVHDGIVGRGSFLQAVLENNLVEAFGRADHENIRSMRAWAAWLYNDAPSGCWGSPEKVAAWREYHQQRRAKPAQEQTP